jgi:hypothetical protein
MVFSIKIVMVAIIESGGTPKVRRVIEQSGHRAVEKEDTF